MKKYIFVLWAACLLVPLAGYPAGKQVGITAGLRSYKTGEIRLSVQVAITPGFKLYADRFRVEAFPPVKIIPLAVPTPRIFEDAVAGETNLVYEHSFSAVYLVENFTNDVLSFTVRYQGCNQTGCFMPAAEEFRLKIGDSPLQLARAANEPGVTNNEYNAFLANIRSNYQAVAKQSGYMDARDFLAFLDFQDNRSLEPGPIRRAWHYGSLWISVLLMILGGLALNLTPCVLPLIPVNLAIIGAGVRAVSARRGFLLGTLYGLGIVLAYGGLGLATVLTGTQFGSIAASPWFNLGVALLFLVLGLALLDLIVIDFSRLQNRINLEGKGLLFVILPGAVSALLAGSCVAPVVIAVLLLSSDLYLKGQMIGLVLPFLLGLGMALPWPFAGAGLTFLPKPGRWMTHVKHIFAVVIILAGLYYLLAGVRMFSGKDKSPGENVPASQAQGNWSLLPDGLPAGEMEEMRSGRGRPVLIYFAASWCRDCKAMNLTTFRSPAVRKKMDEFICVKVPVENPGDSLTRMVLREFDVVGLPTFVIFKPNETQDAKAAARTR